MLFSNSTIYNRFIIIVPIEQASSFFMYYIQIIKENLFCNLFLMNVISF